MNITYGAYHNAQIATLHKTFLKAFETYFVNFQPTQEQFEKRINHKIGIEPKLSRIAWDGDQMVGFILHTLGNYQHKRTLYNGGIGVIPEYRRRKIATELYLNALQTSLEEKAERVLLEVVENNTSGLKLYESLDFKFTRMLRCFKLKKRIDATNPNILIQQAPIYKRIYTSHFSFLPGFMDCSHQIIRNLENEIILEAKINNQLVGHIIFQPAIGRISQLAVAPNFRQRGVAKSLLSAAQMQSTTYELTLMNIPEEEHDSIAAFERLGFHNELNQIELVLTL